MLSHPPISPFRRQKNPAPTQHEDCYQEKQAQEHADGGFIWEISSGPRPPFFPLGPCHAMTWSHSELVPEVPLVSQEVFIL